MHDAALAPGRPTPIEEAATADTNLGYARHRHLKILVFDDKRGLDHVELNDAGVATRRY
jgi:hypothetical protein